MRRFICVNISIISMPNEWKKIQQPVKMLNYFTDSVHGGFTGYRSQRIKKKLFWQEYRDNVHKMKIKFFFEYSVLFDYT